MGLYIPAIILEHGHSFGCRRLIYFRYAQYDEWRFVAPACLIFYGLALVNASKYTLTDIRYLGYCEIVFGLINMQWIGYGLYFWAWVLECCILCMG